jgi:hypothetical protein
MVASALLFIFHLFISLSSFFILYFYCFFYFLVWDNGGTAAVAACVGLAGWAWRRLAAVRCSTILYFIDLQASINPS